MQKANPPFYQKNFQLPAQPGGTVVPTKQVPWQFGFNQKIQTNKIKTSTIDIQNPIQLTSISVGTGSFANNTSLFLSSNLTMNSPHQNDITFAVPYVAIYQGVYASVYDSNFQIYPTVGGSITPFSYLVQGETDWHLTDGTNSAWGGAILNNTGVTGTISFLIQWRFFFYNAGVGALS